MTFNPLIATQEIQKSYIDFYKTTFSLNNKKLSDKLDKLSENNMLWTDPFISLSQNYIPGKTLKELQSILDLSEDLVNSIPIENLFEHQENAIINIIRDKRHTVVSSGTGSGKTESFLIPVLNECIKSNASGLKAILIYPMNALANEQVDRLRSILFKLNNARTKLNKREITFGIYTGYTPNNPFDKQRNIHDLLYKCPRCKQNSTLTYYKDGKNNVLKCQCNSELIKFQILTRTELQNNPPDILITNYVMLNRFLMRSADKSLFENNNVKFLVVDEIHTYGGAKGVDVSLLLRRLVQRLQKNASTVQDIICIGTSATMSKDPDDENKKNKIREFASKLLGVEFHNNDIIEGQKSELNFPFSNKIEKLVKLDISESLENLTDHEFENLCKQISNETFPSEIKSRSKFLGMVLNKNIFFQELVKNLIEPETVNELRSSILQNNHFKEHLSSFDDKEIDIIIWSYLKAGSLASDPTLTKTEPLLKVNIHNFFRMFSNVYMCTNPQCAKIYFISKNTCSKCDSVVEELAVCRRCSEEFFISHVDKNMISGESEKINKRELIDKLKTHKEKENSGSTEFTDLLNNYNIKPIKCYSSYDTDLKLEEMWYKICEPTKLIDEDKHIQTNHLKKCLTCGSFNIMSAKKCILENDKGNACNSIQLIEVEIFPPRTNTHTSWRPRDCPYCNFSYGSKWAVTPLDMDLQQSSTHFFIMTFNKIKNHKLLIFSDSRQDAASLAGWLDFIHEDTVLKQLIIQKLEELSKIKQFKISYIELISELLKFIANIWYNSEINYFDRSIDEFQKKFLETITDNKRLSIEKLGLIEYNYIGLHNYDEFKQSWKSELKYYKHNISNNVFKILNLETNLSNQMNLLVTLVLNVMRRHNAIEGLELRNWNEKAFAQGFIWNENNDDISDIKGTKIYNFASKKSDMFLIYIKKIFDIDDDEAFLILKFIWYFIVNQKFIICKKLVKFKTLNNPLAYILNIKKLELTIPQKIHKCEKCNECFTDILDNKCRSIKRRKLCTGDTKEIPYWQFLKLNNDDHFFTLFKNIRPIRMITKEHTGALSNKDKKFIQDSFSAENQIERKIDVIVATPTLELGVDIGDLSSVGLYKSPPSPISYIQRVGRAGRRDGISFINTFFANSSIDEYYFRKPQELIKGYFDPPYINFESQELIKRHFNAVILEELAVSNLGPLLTTKIVEFVRHQDKNLNDILQFIENKKNSIDAAFKIILDNILIHPNNFDIDNSIMEFKNNFIKILEEFKKELDYTNKNLRFNSNKIEQLNKKSKDLNAVILIEYFFMVNFLPKFAFPSTAVQIEDISGLIYHGGRPKNIAVTEFAPNCEITWKKKIYKSIGINTDADPQIFYICNNCQKYYAKKILIGKTCQYCSKIIQKPLKLLSISPTTIFLEKTTKTVTESRQYNEAKLNIFLPKLNSELDEKSISTKSFDVKLTKYNNIDMLLMVNEIYIETDDIDNKLDPNNLFQLQICQTCGRVNDSKYGIHNRSKRKLAHKTPFKSSDSCNGEFIKTGLHHEMSTNVISIKITPKNNTQQITKEFLITLKSALIYAGQSTVGCIDGEIDGVVKNNELFLFDNVDGGVGYVDIIFNRFVYVLQKSYDIINDEVTIYKETCYKGCLHCLWSYRHKRDIPYINKLSIIKFLQEISCLPIRNDIDL